MSEIIRLLTDNPILLILLVTWILSALGGVFTRAARKAEQQRRQAQQGQGQRQAQGRQRAERRPAGTQWPKQQQRWPEQPKPEQHRPARQPTAAPAPRQVRTERPRPMTPEEAAAQIRRLMGMEPEAPPAPMEPEPPRPPPEPVRESKALARPLGGLGGTGRRQLEIHVDSHVGEKMHDRRMARHRSSLAPQRPLPSSAPAAPRRRPYELSELRNLPKAFVLREILGPPKALQSEWQ